MKLRVIEKLRDRVQGAGKKNLASSLKKKNYSWLVACGFWILVSNSFTYPAFSKNLTPNSSALAERENINDGAKSFCTDQNLETLTIQLLQDLPSYTNRASQRARRLSRSSDIYSYMLVAGRLSLLLCPLTLKNIVQMRLKALHQELSKFSLLLWSGNI